MKVNILGSSAVDKLKNVDLLIPHDLLAKLLLYSLPTSLQNFQCAIESRWKKSVM